VKPFHLILALLIGAGVLTAVALSSAPGHRRARWLAVLAVVPVGAAATMVAFVLAEDTYRDNGTSRWDAYRSPGGALGELFVASVTAACLAGILVACGAVAGRPAITRAALVIAALVLLVFVLITVEFSAN
jgi:hypothetical protein